MKARAATRVFLCIPDHAGADRVPLHIAHGGHAVQASSVVGGYFGIKEMTEILGNGPRLWASRTCQVGPSWVVDVQGTITTLATGQRVIVPSSVWLYTDGQGRAAPPYVSLMGGEWAHKLQIQ
jgi:hypothetical protein